MKQLPCTLAFCLLVAGPAAAYAADFVDTQQGYTIEFLDRVYDFPTDRTFFYYEVVVSLAAAHDVSNFTIELCDSLDVDWDSITIDGQAAPSGKIDSRDPTAMVDYGIKWDESIAKGTSKQFGFGLEGNVPLGVTESYLKAGQLGFIKRGRPQLGGSITGPTCELRLDRLPGVGSHIIRGRVFLDASRSGDLDDFDPGVVGVTVLLTDARFNVLDSATTDARGDFVFAELPTDTYVVRVPGGDAATPNGTLSTFFVRSGATNAHFYAFFALNGNVSAVDFGFAMNPNAIADSGRQPGTGRSPEFWAQCFDLALAGVQQGAPYTSAELGAFLSQIGGPLGWNEHRIREAHRVLSGGSDAVSEFHRNLLAVQLNEASGQGLTGNHALLQTYLVRLAECTIMDPYTLDLPALRMLSFALAATVRNG